LGCDPVAISTAPAVSESATCVSSRGKRLRPRAA